MGGVTIFPTVQYPFSYSQFSQLSVELKSSFSLEVLWLVAKFDHSYAGVGYLSAGVAYPAAEFEHPSAESERPSAEFDHPSAEFDHSYAGVGHP